MKKYKAKRFKSSNA